jgi:group I intron endonuclease
MSCGIYAIFNKITGWVYVGQAYDVDKRWIRHQYELNNNRHHCSHLQRSWDKHTQASFYFVQLSETLTNELTKEEQNWMDYYKRLDIPLYNILPAKRSHLGIKRSEETKHKISAANKGRKYGQKYKDKCSKRQAGVSHGPLSEETKQKISASNKGKILSPEHAAKAREQLEKTRVLCKQRRKEVMAMEWTIQCPDGSIVITKELKQFCLDNGLSMGTLHEVLTKKSGRTQHKGYKLPGGGYPNN